MNDIPDEELSWTDEPVIRLAILTALKDSMGHPIEPYRYYNVAKHKPSGKIIILSTDKNMKDDFVNEVWKKQGKQN